MEKCLPWKSKELRLVFQNIQKQVGHTLAIPTFRRWSILASHLPPVGPSQPVSQILWLWLERQYKA